MHSIVTKNEKGRFGWFICTESGRYFFNFDKFSTYDGAFRSLRNFIKRNQNKVFG